MMSALKSRTPWRALVAVAALAVAAAPARAGLSLSFTGPGTVMPTGITIDPMTGLFSGSSGAYSYSGKATESGTSTSQSINLTI